MANSVLSTTVPVRRLIAPAFDTVRPAIFEAAELAWTEAVRRGHERIGFALYHHTQGHPDDLVRESVAARCACSGKTVPPFTAHTVRWDPPPEGFAEWLQEYRPDCVIGFNAVTAHWMQEYGWRVPEDIGFVGLVLDPDNPINASGTAERRTEITHAAMDRLDLLFRRGWRGIPDVPQHTLLQSRWIEGGTLPGPADARKGSKRKKARAR